MTSANLSLGDRFKNHRTYINRTLWTSYVALPFLAAYFIMGVIMVVSRSINYAVLYEQSADVLAREKLIGVSKILGFSQPGWVLVIAIAIMFALQGFSYVFNVSQIDFYLSQPTTRAQRIRKNYTNAITTFFVMYICSEIIAIIIASVMGAMNRFLLMSALVESLRALNLFFAFYNITVLAVMLSGTLPIAILLTAGFAFIPIMLVGELDLYSGIFFATYSDIKPFNVFLSPLFDRLAAWSDLPSKSDAFMAVGSLEGFEKCLQSVLPREIDTLIVGIIAFVAVLIFSRSRHSEWAGKSIPVRPFRWFVKILACFIVGLGAGYFVYLMYIGVWNKRLYPMMCVLMIVAAVFTGCVMEVILEGNIRRFFKGMAQTTVAACLVLLTFIIYRGDLLGYDSYVPAASKVESCAIVGGNRNFNTYNGISYLSYTGQDMVLSNAEDVIEIAKAGMKLQKESVESEKNSYSQGGYYLTVLYRMKNGQKIYRQLQVPYDTYDEQMDRIVSSEEFKRGYFDIFDDESIRTTDPQTEYHILRYVSLGVGNDTRDFDYTKVSDAYRKDLLENYSFKDIKNKMPIGSIEYENTGNNYVFGSLEVFDTFSNTIALLKEYGIFSEGELRAEDVREIKVTNYFVGQDLDSEPQDEIVYDNTEYTSKSYTDQGDIEKIIEVSIPNGYHNPWFNYNNTNDQYGIELYLKGNNSGISDLYYNFYKGKVPDFVKRDTEG